MNATMEESEIMDAGGIPPVRRVSEEEKKSVFAGFIAEQRGIKRERRAAVALAAPALERLCQVLCERSGQPKHLRGLMFSLYNGQPVSLLEVLTLDWEIKKDFCALVLAFGYENGPAAICDTPDFFYAAMKEAITKAGQWDWFLEAYEEEGEA